MCDVSDLLFPDRGARKIKVFWTVLLATSPAVAPHHYNIILELFRVHGGLYTKSPPRIVPGLQQSKIITGHATVRRWRSTPRLEHRISIGIQLQQPTEINMYLPVCPCAGIYYIIYDEGWFISKFTIYIYKVTFYLYITRVYIKQMSPNMV